MQLSSVDSSLHGSEMRLRGLGMAGVYLLAFGAFLSPAMGSIAQALLLLVVLVNVRQALRDIWSTAYGKILAAFAIYALVRAWMASQEFGHTDSQFEQASDYIRMGLFPLAGWVMFRARMTVSSIAIAFFAGIAVDLIGGLLPLVQGEWHADGRYRLYSGTHPNETGLFLSVAIVGLLTVLVYLQRHADSIRRVRLWSVLGFLLLLGALAGSAFTESRNSWLSLASALTVLAVAWWFLRRHLSLRISPALYAAGAVVLVLVATLGYLQKDRVLGAGVSKDNQAAKAIVEGRFDEVPTSSWGLRYQMYSLGLSHIAERPLFGYGPYAKYLIEESSMPYKAGNLHNGYIEVVLRFGLVGGGIFLAGIIALWWGMLRAGVSGNPVMPPELFLFFLGSTVILCVWNLFDYRFTHYDFLALTWLLFGLMYSKLLELRPLPGRDR